MRARDVYLIEYATVRARPWWRRFLAAGFGALGDYPAGGQLLIADAATGRMLAAMEADGETMARVEADLDQLTDVEFARRWLPPPPPEAG